MQTEFTNLVRELEHVRAERDAADQACARLEAENQVLHAHLAHASAYIAALELRCAAMERRWNCVAQEVHNG